MLFLDRKSNILWKVSCLLRCPFRLCPAFSIRTSSLPAWSAFGYCSGRSVVDRSTGTPQSPLHIVRSLRPSITCTGALNDGEGVPTDPKLANSTIDVVCLVLYAVSRTVIKLTIGSKYKS